MYIDKTRGHHAARCIDFLCSRLGKIPHRYNAITDDADIHDLTRRSASINDQAARNFQVVHDWSPCSVGTLCAPFLI